jgi:hypothetical protein
VLVRSMQEYLLDMMDEAVEDLLAFQVMAKRSSNSTVVDRRESRK